MVLLPVILGWAENDQSVRRAKNSAKALIQDLIEEAEGIQWDYVNATNVTRGEWEAGYNDPEEYEIHFQAGQRFNRFRADLWKAEVCAKLASALKDLPNGQELAHPMKMLAYDPYDFWKHSHPDWQLLDYIEIPDLLTESTAQQNLLVLERAKQTLKELYAQVEVHTPGDYMQALLLKNLDLSFVEDTHLRQILERRWEEGYRAGNAGAYFPAIVTFASLMEGVLGHLFDAMGTEKREEIKGRLNTDQSKNWHWNFANMILAAPSELNMSGPIVALLEFCRRERNNIHPNQAIKNLKTRADQHEGDLVAALQSGQIGPEEFLAIAGSIPLFLKDVRRYLTQQTDQERNRTAPDEESLR